MGEYLKIYLDGEPAPQIVLFRMKNILDELPSGQFLRIHKSYIVSPSRVKEAGRSSVTLQDGTVLPLGETYREEFRKYLLSLRNHVEKTS